MPKFEYDNRPNGIKIKNFTFFLLILFIGGSLKTSQETTNLSLKPRIVPYPYS